MASVRESYKGCPTCESAGDHGRHARLACEAIDAALAKMGKP